LTVTEPSDTEMLDWIEQEGLCVCYEEETGTLGNGEPYCSPQYWVERYFGEPLAEAKGTLREAIIAAMASEPDTVDGQT